MSKINKIKLSGTTYDIQDLSATSVVNVTQAEYDALVTGGTVDPTALYNITDATAVDISQYWNSAETQSAITQAVSGKQDTLVSGTNIKTINNESLLGSGNIDIQSGGGKAVTGGTNISVTTGETADTINCTIPFEDSSKNLLLGYNLTVGGGTYYSLGISPKDSSSSIQTKINGNNAIAIGNNVTITGGTGNRGEYSVAIGKNTNVNGLQSTALGIGCNANGNTTLAIGRYSTSKGNDSVAIGNQANVNGNSSVAIGRLAKVSGDSSVAIGSGATANGVDYKTNINNQLTIDTSNQVYIYNKDNTEMICLQDQLGGGGSSYTAGDGIDITNDVISVSGVVMSSAITTSITSSSTDAQVPSAKAVYDTIGNINSVLNNI